MRPGYERKAKISIRLAITCMCIGTIVFSIFRELESSYKPNPLLLGSLKIVWITSGAIGIIGLPSYWWFYLRGRGYNPLVEAIMPLAFFTGGAIWVAVKQASKIPEFILMGAGIIAIQSLLKPDLHPESEEEKSCGQNR